MDQAWHDAHIRATSWISLGLKENILTDVEIPDHLEIVSGVLLMEILERTQILYLVERLVGSKTKH